MAEKKLYCIVRHEIDSNGHTRNIFPVYAEGLKTSEDFKRRAEAMNQNTNKFVKHVVHDGKFSDVLDQWKEAIA